jgi:hypothetical protein
MDEITKLIPLWCASKPSHFIFIAETPDWNCLKCSQNFWREPTKVEVATADPFGNMKPLSIWIATSECFLCGEPHKWLIDPDKPIDFENGGFGKPVGEHASDFLRADDSLIVSDPPSFFEHLEKFEVDENGIGNGDVVPFKEWCKRFGETDLESYLRWLKAQRKDDPNDQA